MLLRVYQANSHILPKIPPYLYSYIVRKINDHRYIINDERITIQDSIIITDKKLNTGRYEIATLNYQIIYCNILQELMKKDRV